MKARTLLSLFLILAILVGCSSPRVTISEVELTDLNGELVTIHPSKHPLTVIYFLSPECPLCINYTKEIKRLDETFHLKGVAFFGVFPGEWYSAAEINDFRIKYHIDVPFYIDPKNKLVHALDATVTPECFVIDSTAQLVYSGKIDNWVNALGKKKLEVSEAYLEDALVAALEGKAPKTAKTKPIGCLIE